MTQPMDIFDPAHTALLVMNYQYGVLARTPDVDSLLSRAADTLQKVRRTGSTICYVRTAFNSEDLCGFPDTNKMARRLVGDGLAFHESSPYTAIHEMVLPEAGDIIVRKTRVGAFSTTDLDDQLRARDIDTLLVAGITTSGVVLSTVRDGVDRDYHILVIADLCADHDKQAHELLMGRLFLSQVDVFNAADLKSVETVFEPVGGGPHVK